VRKREGKVLNDEDTDERSAVRTRKSFFVDISRSYTDPLKVKSER